MIVLFSFGQWTVEFSSPRADSGVHSSWVNEWGWENTRCKLFYSTLLRWRYENTDTKGYSSWNSQQSKHLRSARADWFALSTSLTMSNANLYPRDMFRYKRSLIVAPAHKLGEKFPPIRSSNFRGERGNMEHLLRKKKHLQNFKIRKVSRPIGHRSKKDHFTSRWKHWHLYYV